MEIIFAFQTTSIAILAEQALLGAGIAVRVMSLPSSIQAGCGICLRVVPRDVAAAEEVLKKAGAVAYDLYTRTLQNQQSSFAAYEREA